MNTTTRPIRRVLAAILSFALLLPLYNAKNRLLTHREQAVIFIYIFCRLWSKVGKAELDGGRVLDRDLAVAVDVEDLFLERC